MLAYLLTWSPLRSSVATLVTAWERQQREGPASGERWSCGNTKSIPSGSRVFLFRQGAEPRGIVASGWVTRGSFQASHWDNARARRGETTNHVTWMLDAVCEGFGDTRHGAASEMFPLQCHRTDDPILASVNWRAAASGIRIPDEAAHRVEILWAKHLGVETGGEFSDQPLSALEGEKRERLIQSRHRESSLRRAKIKKAIAESHDGLPRCEVPGCGFCFATAYGEIGERFAHVHHLHALANREGAETTSLADLAVVCANCHAMIHIGGECRPLEGLMKGQASR